MFVLFLLLQFSIFEKLGWPNACNVFLSSGTTDLDLRRCHTSNPKEFCRLVATGSGGGSSSSDSSSESIRRCLDLCAIEKKASNCGGDPAVTPKCTSIADCQSAAKDNAEQGAKAHDELGKNAGEGAKIAEDAQAEHVKSIDRQLQKLQSQAAANPQKLADLQNDRKVFQQIQQDLKDKKAVSLEYADLAKDKSIQQDVRALAFFSNGKKSFEGLVGYHAEQYKQFQLLAEKAGAGVKSLESVRARENLTKAGAFEDSKTADKKLDAAAMTNESEKKKSESKSGLTAAQLAELDKKLKKISNRALREKLRAKLLADLKKDPNKFAEVLDGLEERVNDIQKLQDLENNPLQLDQLLNQAEKDLSLGSTQEFHDDIKNLEDEKAGILASESMDLFARIHSYLVQCQKRKCVIGPGQGT